MRIQLAPTRLPDEAYYRCEITYEETGRWFKESCLQNQLTRLTVLGKPTFMRMETENGSEVRDKAVIGPYDEGAMLVMRCSAGGGRPIPAVIKAKQLNYVSII